MAMSKNEKNNSAKKVAESKAQAKKATRASGPQTGMTGGKVVKGKKPLGNVKKK